VSRFELELFALVKNRKSNDSKTVITQTPLRRDIRQFTLVFAAIGNILAPQKKRRNSWRLARLKQFSP